MRHAAHDALRRVLPYTAQLLASTAAYGLGVTATQLFGYALRISCATPVLGPCFGVLGVGFASALAGRAAVQTQQLFEAGGDARRVRWWAPVAADEALLDSFMGVLFFKVAWQKAPFAGALLASIACGARGTPFLCRRSVPAALARLCGAPSAGSQP